MSDKFIVKNNSGNVLMLSKSRITLAVGGVIDLAPRLEKTVSELHRDREISAEIANGNLVKIEEFDSSTEAGLDKKLDMLIGLMKNKTPAPIQSAPASVDLSGMEEMIKNEIRKISNRSSDDSETSVSEEDKMREEALMAMIKKKSKESNLKGFGGKDKETESDDFTDLIDF